MWLLARVMRGIGDQAESKRLERKRAELLESPDRKHAAVTVSYSPERPVLGIADPLVFGKEKIYSHSYFGVTLTNPSERAIEIESIVMRSTGTSPWSGLGDIKNYWEWPNPMHRLEAGESVHLERVWGLHAHDGQHQQMAYLFDYCWHGVSSRTRQCGVDWVDLFPE
jgi:hypothetical protein